jgi:hypothetical protein
MRHARDVQHAARGCSGQSQALHDRPESTPRDCRFDESPELVAICLTLRRKAAEADEQRSGSGSEERLHRLGHLVDLQ